MGILDKFKGKDGGIRCESLPDGTGVQCEVFKKDAKGEKHSTGTNFAVIADSNNNCETSFEGPFDVTDGDDDRVKKISQQVKNACLRQKGFA